MSRPKELPKRPFDLSTKMEFSIQLGRGSGLHGLQLAKVDNKGNVRFYKLNGDYTQFKLNSAELDSIVRAAERSEANRIEIKATSIRILWMARNR